MDDENNNDYVGIQAMRGFVWKCLKFFAMFLKFFLRLAGFSMFLDLLGPVRMHSDPFGCSRMHSEAFGCVRTHSEKFRKFETNFGPKHQFFAIFANFLRSWSKMHLKINFRVKFCSRYTHPEVCATKNHEKNSLCRRNLASASPISAHLGVYLRVGNAHLPTNIKW